MHWRRIQINTYFLKCYFYQYEIPGKDKFEGLDKVLFSADNSFTFKRFISGNLEESEGDICLAHR